MKKTVICALIFIMNCIYAEEVYTRITSEGKLILNYKEKIANFFDNVLVKNQQGTLKSDKLTVFFAVNGEDIEKMIATGHVFIDQKEHQAEGQRAEYFTKESKLILTGDPIIKKGANYYSADKITIDTKTDKVYFEPSAKIVIKKQPQEDVKQSGDSLL